jgi:DNA gyrase subunit A
LREKFGDDRRTKIVAGPVGEFSMEDLVPQEDTLVMLTQDGLYQAFAAGYVQEPGPRR